VILTIMSNPLPDADLEQIEQRAGRALDAAPATPQLETSASKLSKAEH
jgi:hypothetical protein